MSMRKIKRWNSVIAFVAVTAVIFQPQLLVANEFTSQPITQISHDVMLAEGGVLVGQLVNEQGEAMPMEPISLQTGGKEIARLTTDNAGNFKVSSLKGGVYQVVAVGHQGIYRFWAPQTAPPSAQHQLVVISSKQDVVRGQFNAPPSNPLAKIGQFVAEHPIITAAAVGSAIAIPLALDDDDPPATP